MKQQIKIRALIIILILTVSCLIAIFASIPHILNPSTSYTAYIYKNGDLVETIPVSDVSETYQITIGDPDKEYNILEIVPGAIRILQASCPDKICVNQGYIRDSLIPITCLPHHLVIELKANAKLPNAPSADAVTY